MEATDGNHRRGCSEDVEDLGIAEVGQDDAALFVETHLATFAIANLQGLGRVAAAEGTDDDFVFLVVCLDAVSGSALDVGLRFPG